MSTKLHKTMKHFSEWYEKNGHNILFVLLFCKSLLFTGFMKNWNNFGNKGELFGK